MLPRHPAALLVTATHASVPLDSMRGADEERDGCDNRGARSTTISQSEDYTKVVRMGRMVSQFASVPPEVNTLAMACPTLG